MKEHPIIFNTEMVKAILDGRKSQTRRVVVPQPKRVYRDAGEIYLYKNKEDDDVEIKWKYHVGDRLWVRETWMLGWNIGGEVTYKADEKDGDYMGKWKPSVHMPRWASRITLEITGVKAERVQEIRLQGKVAEGINMNHPMQIFKELWNSINAKRGYSWESNPWVWVIEFKRIGGRDG